MIHVELALNVIALPTKAHNKHLIKYTQVINGLNGTPRLSNSLHPSLILTIFTQWLIVCHNGIIARSP